MRNLIVAGCLSLLAANAVAAAPILSVEADVDVPSGLYSYSLANFGPTAVLGFSVLVSASVEEAVAPVGWIVGTVALGNFTNVQWVSSDVIFDLAPGNVLRGFLIRSGAPSGTVEYSAFDEALDFASGDTLGPVDAKIPEPPVVALSLVTVILVLLRHRSDMHRAAS